MKVSVLTLGCKVNQAEALFIEGILKGQGDELIGLEGQPDLCIINTCTVTAKSDYQSRQLIRRAHRTGARVIVTGCYAELNKEAIKAMPEVQEVIGNKDKYNYIAKLAGNNGSAELSYAKTRTRLFLKVQDGCDSSCSYCIIPLARGSSRSISLDKAIKDVKMAVDAGFKEVVLTGIHLGAYGRDLSPKKTLSDLVEEILGRTEVQRLRLSSLEVTEIGERLIGLFDSKRLCLHLHIPLQSGDNRILMLMNRNYDSKYYSNKVRAIADRFPDISIGTDVIAGFPGEGVEEFNNTFNVINGLPFAYIHVFPFSPRKGTRAYSMPGDVPEHEKRLRCASLRRLAHRKKQDYMRDWLGKTLDVLIEGKNKEGHCLGTSSNYLKVAIRQGGGLTGSLVPVRAEELAGGILLGDL